MKLFKFLSLIITAFFFSSLLYAQNSFYKDAVLTKTDGEPINVKIKFISESNLSKEVTFVNASGSNEERLSPFEVEEVCFIESDICFSPIKYKYNQAGVEVVEVRLAKKMVTGYSNLYKLQLPESEYNTTFEKDNTYIYILEKEGEFYVLRQIEKIEGNTYWVDKRYRNILAYVYQDKPELRNRIEHLDFTDNDLQGIVVDYNGKNGGNISKVHKSEVKSIKYHEVEAGYVNVTNIPDLDGFGVNIGYNLTIFNPDLSEKIGVNIGIAYSNFQLKGDNISKENISYIRVPLLAKYRFSKSNFMPFLSLGITPLLNSRNTDFYIHTGAGVNIGKRLSFKSYLESETLSFNGAILAYFTVGFNINRGK